MGQVPVAYTQNGSKQFTDWLDRTMTARNMTAVDVGSRIGVHNSTISRWRHCQGVPDMKKFAQLAMIFDVPVLRLAVTAGLVPADVAGVEPLSPPPPPAEDVEAVTAQLRAIRGISEQTRQALIAQYRYYVASRRYNSNASHPDGAEKVES